MSRSPRQRVVVMISGRGTNMGALIAAGMDPLYPGQVVAVISNRADAPGLETARRYDIPAKAIDQTAYASREEHEAAVIAAIEDSRPDVICLAGYMRLLSEDFVRRYEGRIINIHPSLLPLFPGLDTHRRALSAGMRIHGCTVHYVTDRMDEGPIIAQAAIGIEPGDTPQSLAERLLRAEHRLYPHALKLVLTGEVRIANGRAVLRMPARRRVGETDDPDLQVPPATPILVAPDARQN